MKNISAAFVKAQAEINHAKKDSENPHFKSKYADLTSCWEACADALKANDIAVIQGVHGDRLKTTLIHSSGESMSDEGIHLCGFENAKIPMQALGSALTYARRYGLCSMLGIAPEDDDAQALTKDTPKKAPWNGPLDAQALKVSVTSLVKDLHAQTDIDELKELVSASLPVINQCQIDHKEWASKLDVLIKDKTDELKGNA